MPYFYDQSSKIPSGGCVMFFDLPDKRIRADKLVLQLSGRKLWTIERGSPYQIDALMTKIASECSNRSLPIVRLCFHHDPVCFGLLIGDDRAVLASSQLIMPLYSSGKSLAPLVQKRLRADELRLLEEFAVETDKSFTALAALKEIAAADAALESELIFQYILTEKLDAFANRLMKKLRIVSDKRSLGETVCCFSILSGRPIRSDLPQRTDCRIIPVSERTPVSHITLTQICAELSEKGAQFTRYIDYFGRTEGVYIPSADVYIGLGREGSATDKTINAARFVSSDIRQEREYIRASRVCRDEMMQKIGILERKIADLYQKTDEIYKRSTSKSDFERFGKDLLIEIFK